MPVGFYELLQIAPDASAEAVRAAWQEQVAQVVRKMRNAEAKKLDRAPIEARRLSLNEAYAVLSDPARRRRYDRFREVTRTGLPTEPDELWRAAGVSLVDPGAAAAVEVLRALTELKVGPPFSAQPERTQPREVTNPGVPVAEVQPVAPTLPPPSIAPDAVESPAVRRPQPTARVAPASGPAIDRSASAEALARLFDQYGPTGAFLRATRDARRVSTADLSTLTRVSQRFLDAMERDAFTELPGATFVRGYLKMVLRALDALDPAETEEFIEGYMSRFHRARG